MKNRHDDCNDKCPLNDPDPLVSNPTMGVACTCPVMETSLECAAEGCDYIHPNATQQNPGSARGWLCVRHGASTTVACGKCGGYGCALCRAGKVAPPASELVEELSARCDRLERRMDGVRREPTEQAELAQAALDIVVGFQIRAEGDRIQVGALEDMFRFRDSETARSIETILRYARASRCQGLNLLTAYDKSDDEPRTGIFADPLKGSAGVRRW